MLSAPLYLSTDLGNGCWDTRALLQGNEGVHRLAGSEWVLLGHLRPTVEWETQSCKALFETPCIVLSKKCMCWCFIHYWIEKCTVKQWNCLINWKWCGRKWSWLYLRWHWRIFLDGPSLSPRSKFEHGTSGVWSKSAKRNVEIIECSWRSPDCRPSAASSNWYKNVGTVLQFISSFIASP